MTTANLYIAGYGATYKDMYAALRNENHIGHCGTCRQCGVVKEVTEVLLEALAQRMTKEEFLSLAVALSRSAPPGDEPGVFFVFKWEGTDSDSPPLFHDWEQEKPPNRWPALIQGGSNG